MKINELSNKESQIKPKSLRLNFVLNLTRTVLNFVFPLIIFPYVSRILGPNGLGKVEFANSIISYFVLFATLGIPTYGIREIARNRDDEYQRSKIVAELSIITSISVLLCYFFYFIIVFSLKLFNSQLILFLLVSPSILLQAYNYEWFYKGIEDQVYITTRFIIMKIIQIIIVFVLIKTSENYLRYAAIYVGMNGISSIFYLIRLHKYIKIVNFRDLRIIKHIKPIFINFSASIATTIYLHLDVSMLGIFVDENAVGLYTTANKLIRIVISVVTSLAIVMIPRLANNLSNGDTEEYKKNLNKSLNFILLIGTPSIFGIIVISSQLIQLFAGTQYLDAVITMKLLTPVILIVGFSNFVGLQILYTNKKEKYYTIAVTCAAFINFICNYILIPKFHENGAVIGTIMAELSGLIIMTILGRKLIIDSNVLDWRLIGYFISSIIMYICITLINKYISNNIIFIIVSGIIVYSLVLICWTKLSGVKLKSLLKK